MQALIFGVGYCGAAIASALRASGCPVIEVTRASGEPLLDSVSHIVSTVPPDASGDPVLMRYAALIAAAPHLQWIGYLSSTVVYGDCGGEWVNEDTPPAPGQPRGRRRLAAERTWSAFADNCAVDIFRLAGIYGPGRSAFDDLRTGNARRVIKPGHAFGRIHIADIVAAVLAAMARHPRSGRRVFNLSDDEPAEQAAVLEEAAALLDVEPPHAMSFAVAQLAMSPMARSFWAENRKVCSAQTQAILGLTWRYPTYREGLRAILAEERQQRSS